MRTTDEELIENWKKKKDKASYNKLKNRHKSMVFMFVNRYQSSSVPRSALEAESWTLFDDAVNNYKPNQGAKFSTYLNYQLRKLDRYTKKYQNVARIPEGLAGKIGDYDRAEQEFKIKHDRIPTHKEMSKQLKMPVSHVRRLNRSRRSDFFEGIFEGNPLDPGEKDTADWLLIELREELTPQERRVYDHLIGYNTQQVTSKKDLAKKLGMSPGRISQITRSIAKKIQPHLRKRL